jgi:hypothetical protein
MPDGVIEEIDIRKVKKLSYLLAGIFCRKLLKPC